MGADDFCAVKTGKTMAEAFAAAVREAQYEYGHGGYTGTIAEKYGYVDFGKLPPRWTVRNFAEALNLLGLDDLDTLGHPQYRAKAKALVARLRRDVPAATLARMAEVYDDKFGNAVGIEVTGKDAAAVKRRQEAVRGRSQQIDARGKVISERKLGPSTRGQKVYAFMGIASS